MKNENLKLKNKKYSKLNSLSVLDKIITEAKIDYVSGNYKTFSKAEDLINELDK